MDDMCPRCNAQSAVPGSNYCGDCQAQQDTRPDRVRIVLRKGERAISARALSSDRRIRAALRRLNRRPEA